MIGRELFFIEKACHLLIHGFDPLIPFSIDLSRQVSLVIAAQYLIYVSTITLQKLGYCAAKFRLLVIGQANFYGGNQHILMAPRVYILSKNRHAQAN